MKTYNVKIDMSVYFDKNFTIEADSPEEAETLALKIAMAEYRIGESINIEEPDGWLYGAQHFDAVNAKEE
jgi:hypothetical protein